MVWAPPPNQTDYTAFIRGVMGIDTALLPDNSPYIGYSLAVAKEIVNSQIAQISGTLFVLATYNLAGDRLLNYAQDQAGKTFFVDARASLKLNSFVAGVVQSASDESTSETLLVQDAAKNFSLMDIQNLKTPYGQAYLAIAQEFGALWGIN